MPKRSRYLDQLDDAATSQDGLVTAAQLRALGVADSVASRRVAGYQWTRVLPGVHLIVGGTPTPRQRERAALLYAGARSLMTGTNALRRYGVRALRLQEAVDDALRPEPVHVLVPHERRRLSTGHVRIERTRRLPAPLFVDGLALAPAARAVADAARRIRARQDVAAVVAEVVRRGLADHDTLGTELVEGSRRGSAHLRAILGDVVAGVWSGPEAQLRSVLAPTSLPEPLWNRLIVSSHGELVGRPDGWLDDVGLALEIDSEEHHGDPAGLARTTARNARYARHGIIVYPVRPADLARDPDRIVRDILQAYRVAAARPRPDVHVVDSSEASAGREGWRWGA